MDSTTLPIDETPCTEVHPSVKLQCYKKGPHTVHFCERSKNSETYHAKDVWVWWEGAFIKRGRLWPADNDQK